MIKIVFSVAAAFGIFYFFSARFGWERAFSALADFRWPMGVAALALYGVTISIKAFRFRYFLRGALRFRAIFGIAAIHSFWNNLLPFRSGELSYIYLVRKSGKVDDGANVASLVAARVLDAVVVALFLFLSSFFLISGRFPLGSGERFWLLAFAAGIPFFLWVTALRGNVFRGMISRAAGYSSHPLVRNIFEKINEAVSALAVLSGAGMFVSFFLLSLLVWAGDFLFVWTAFGAAGIILAPTEALFMAAFPVIAALIPFQSPAGIGTFEGTMVAGLLALGIGGGAAVGVSVIFHAVLLFSSFIFFLIAYWFNRLPALGEGVLPRTHTEFYASLNSPEDDFRNSALADLALSYVRGKTLLDAGCGYGLLVSRAQKRGWAVKGIDPDPDAVALSRRLYGDLPIVKSTIDDFNTEELFDTVICLDVLQAVSDDHAALRKIASLVRAGGRLIVAVPSYPRFFGARDRMMAYWRRYRREELAREIASLDFEILEKRYWNMISVVPYFLLYSILKKDTHAAGLRGGNAPWLLARPMLWWFRYVENRINFGFGLSAIIIAQKSSVPYSK